VPKGITYNREFSAVVVMPSLIENVWSRTRWKMLKGWLIPMDNACPHNSGLKGVSRLRNQTPAAPAYNPDLAPSAFFLFGHSNENYLITIVRTGKIS
jgi:hypothetical protein